MAPNPDAWLRVGLARLAADRQSSRWQRVHAGLLELAQLDLG
jgi:hypothetical protein